MNSLIPEYLTCTKFDTNCTINDANERSTLNAIVCALNADRCSDTPCNTLQRDSVNTLKHYSYPKGANARQQNEWFSVTNFPNKDHPMVWVAWCPWWLLWRFSLQRSMHTSHMHSNYSGFLWLYAMPQVGELQIFHGRWVVCFTE